MSEILENLLNYLNEIQLFLLDIPFYGLLIVTILICYFYTRTTKADLRNKDAVQNLFSEEKKHVKKEIFLNNFFIPSYLIVINREGREIYVDDHIEVRKSEEIETSSFYLYEKMQIDFRIVKNSLVSKIFNTFESLKMNNFKTGDAYLDDKFLFYVSDIKIFNEKIFVDPVFKEFINQLTSLEDFCMFNIRQSKTKMYDLFFHPEYRGNINISFFSSLDELKKPTADFALDYMVKLTDLFSK